MHVPRLTVAVGLSILATISYAGHDMLKPASLLVPSQFHLRAADQNAAEPHLLANLPEPISTSSFDVGFEVSATRLTHPPAFRLANHISGGTSYPQQMRKNLPFGFDIGASFETLPGSDLQLIGANARYVLVPHSMVLPTIGLRASYSTLNGSDWADVRTRGIDLSLSKGFSLMTPYAGIGSVWVDSDSYEGTGWAQERLHHDKYFVGANFNLPLVNLAVEADRTGSTTSYHAKFGWRW
jgi:hypothetical protein